MLQGYVVAGVAWLYWSRYVSSLLLSWGRYISSLLMRAPAEKPKEDTGASLKRLMEYMLPYLGRFVAVLFLVVVSSYGKNDNSPFRHGKSRRQIRICKRLHGHIQSYAIKMPVMSPVH